MNEERYPEHAKLSKVRERSQAIGEFLDHGRWTLCEWVEDENVGIIRGSILDPDFEVERGGYWRPRPDIQAVLAEHFEIDPEALEREKRDMLERVRG